MNYGNRTAEGRWAELDGVRTPFIRRCEIYAALTIPKLCPPVGYDQETHELQHDWQSLGAQAVNHLSNKFMLSAFAPSRPFVRFEPTDSASQEMVEAGIDPQDLAEVFSLAERKAMKTLDKKKCRPKLYELIRHLIVTGNALMILKDNMRVMGIKRYVVKRSMTGKMIELLIKEEVLFDELDVKAQEEYLRWKHAKEDDTVCFYTWVKFSNGKYYEDQYVNDCKLTGKFSGTYTEKTMPYHAVTWDLSDEANYGTGLVEEYRGDLAALSALSKAGVEAAILASEFRWLVNPAGMTTATDIENSPNGAVLPGVEGDVSIITAGKTAELGVMESQEAKYVNRIGRGFLLNSAVTRNAERVTAEEIKYVAQELETGLGGVYSRLAIDVQEPIAYWVLKTNKIAVDDTEVEIVIITGLDALSRNGDLENLRAFIGDVAQIGNLPPVLLETLLLDNIASDLAAGRGIRANRYVKTQEQVAQGRAQAGAQEAATQAAVTAATQPTPTGE